MYRGADPNRVRSFFVPFPPTKPNMPIRPKNPENMLYSIKKRLL